MIKYPVLILISFLLAGTTIAAEGGFIKKIFSDTQVPIMAKKQRGKPVPPAFLIVPGKRIGLSLLNGKTAVLYKRLGKPASEDASMGGKSMAAWYSKPVIHAGDTLINETDIYSSTPNFGILNASARVQIIRITSASFMTSQRIGVGSSLETVKKSFSRIQKTASYTSPKTKQQVFIYDDAASGIAFEIDKQQNCIGITVHKPGDFSLVIYNSLFSDVKDESSAILPVAKIGLRDNGKTYQLQVGDKFDVKFNQCVGCRYIWEMATIDKNKIMFLEKIDSNRSCTDCVGGTKDVTFHLQVTAKGSSSLVFKLGDEQTLAVTIEAK